MDRSLYESTNATRRSQNTGIAFAQILEVFPETRLCKVRTFMGTGSQDDNYIDKCQWLSQDCHPDGDEATTIPRAGSYALVLYVGGTPFIFGFFNPLTLGGSASIPTDNKEQGLNEGDRVIKTVGGNKIILRAHGEIEIQSTDVCRTIYFPDADIINELCRNYEFATDGGTVNWHNPDDAGPTIYSAEYREDTSRTNVIIVDRGTADGGFISRTVIGPGTPNGVDAPVWSRTIKNTGETELFIRASGAPVGHKLTILPDGSTKLEIGSTAKAEIKASGEFTLDIGPGNGTLNIKPDGTTSFTTASSIAVKAVGDVSLETDGNLTAKVTGNADVQCAKATIKADANTIVGGAVTDNPVNNDPITGIPLQPVGGVDLV